MDAVGLAHVDVATAVADDVAIAVRAEQQVHPEDVNLGQALRGAHDRDVDRVAIGARRGSFGANIVSQNTRCPYVSIVVRTRRVYSSIHAASQHSCIAPSAARIDQPSLAPIETTVVLGFSRATCLTAIGWNASDLLIVSPGSTSLTTFASSPS